MSDTNPACVMLVDDQASSYSGVNHKPGFLPGLTFLRRCDII